MLTFCVSVLHCTILYLAGAAFCSSRTGTETFGEVLQSEAAKNKSLKIDHAALQRVMNLDGSLKQIGGEKIKNKNEKNGIVRSVFWWGRGEG